jgi:hypothetical protein
LQILLKASGNEVKGLIKSPLSVPGISGRYAQALYSAGYKKKNLEILEKDFEEINLLMAEVPQIKIIISIKHYSYCSL